MFVFCPTRYAATQDFIQIVDPFLWFGAIPYSSLAPAAAPADPSSTVLPLISMSPLPSGSSQPPGVRFVSVLGTCVNTLLQLIVNKAKVLF